MTVFFYPTGGLGNQLFQTAHAMSTRSDIAVVSPSPDVWSDVERIIDFQSFPYEVKILPRALPVEFIKIHNLGLRLSSRRTTPGFLYQAYDSFATRIFRRTFGEISSVFVSRDLGFSPSAPVVSGNQFKIGYFQSYIYPEILKNEFGAKIFGIRSGSIRPEVQDLVAEAVKKQPIIVHVRLGDYLNEDRFGLLTQDYYDSALDKLLELEPGRPIWLFSNSRAINTHLTLRISPNRVFLLQTLSSFDTFLLMVHGGGYVLSNSTFGWWAAFLNQNPSTRVIFPTPWFEKLASPSRLTPESWISHDSVFYMR